MHLYIKPSAAARDFYARHGHFYPGDAGLDLFVLEETSFQAGETARIHFGIQCQPKDGGAYLLLPRSSNSIGLIDGGYRGEIMASCDNIKNDPYTVHKGDRLFQLVAFDGSPITFDLRDQLDPSSRGSGGFGSTGQ